MKIRGLSLRDLTKANAKLRAWRRTHNTSAKVAAHRKVLLDRVIESMAFEGESVSKARLKSLLKQKAKGANS